MKLCGFTYSSRVSSDLYPSRNSCAEQQEHVSNRNNCHNSASTATRGVTKADGCGKQVSALRERACDAERQKAQGTRCLRRRTREGTGHRPGVSLRTAHVRRVGAPPLHAETPSLQPSSAGTWLLRDGAIARVSEARVRVGRNSWLNRLVGLCVCVRFCARPHGRQYIETITENNRKKIINHQETKEGLCQHVHEKDKEWSAKAIGR